MYTEKYCFEKSQTAAAQMTEELNIHIEDASPQKLSDVSFINITATVGLQLLNLWLLKVMPRCANDDVTTIKPGHQTTGNARVI